MIKEKKINRRVTNDIRLDHLLNLFILRKKIQIRLNIFEIFNFFGFKNRFEYL
jgi:hypothetical protein